MESTLESKVKKIGVCKGVNKGVMGKLVWCWGKGKRAIRGCGSTNSRRSPSTSASGDKRRPKVAGAQR